MLHYTIKLGPRLSSLAFSAALAGCACAPVQTEPRIETRIVDTACDWTAPIYVSKDDVLTDDTARAILAHNRAGVKICHWQPRKK